MHHKLRIAGLSLLFLVSLTILTDALMRKFLVPYVPPCTCPEKIACRMPWAIEEMKRSGPRQACETLKCMGDTVYAACIIPWGL